MNLIIKKEVAKRIGYDFFAPYGVSRTSWESWRTQQEVDLGTLSKQSLIVCEFTRRDGGTYRGACNPDDIIKGSRRHYA